MKARIDWGGFIGVGVTWYWRRNWKIYIHLLLVKITLHGRKSYA